MFMLLHHVGPRVELVTVLFLSILERQVHLAPDLYVTRIILGAFLIYDQIYWETIQTGQPMEYKPLQTLEMQVRLRFYR